MLPTNNGQFCSALDHRPNPGQVTAAGVLCVECGRVIGPLVAQVHGIELPAPVKSKRAPLDVARVMEAALEDDGAGFCLACGEEQSGCEPDARGYECESCGARKVYGAAELVMMGYAA